MSERRRLAPKEEPPNSQREIGEAGARPVVKKLSKETREEVSKTGRRKRVREFTEEEVQIIQKAACYCLHHFAMLWTTGGFPEERVGENGSRQWIIRVYLRYPTGFEGYLGDLLYDGKEFTELTDRQLMLARAKQIAADPEGIRQWNEYRASTLRTRKT